MSKRPDDKDERVQQGEMERDSSSRKQPDHSTVIQPSRRTPDTKPPATRAGLLGEDDGEKIRIPNVFGERCVRLFVFLLLAKRRLTLDQLVKFMEIPKTNILRLVDSIEAAGYRVRHVYYGTNEDEDFGEYEEPETGEEEWDAEFGQGASDGRKKVLYWLETLQSDVMLHPPGPDQVDIEALRMCTVFAKRLLGADLRARAEVAVALMESLVRREKPLGGDHYALVTPGTIDYSKHQTILRKLIEAIENRQICKMIYRSPWRDQDTVFHVKPLSIFCYKDALYLQTKKALEPGEKKMPKDFFNPLLAVHRIKAVELTDQKFLAEEIEKFDFEKVFNKAFGVIKEKEFEVIAELTDWAATYVEEREWGPKQKVTKRKDGKLIIEFIASSEPEVLSWILQFGEHGKLLKPESIVRELAGVLGEMKDKYA